MTDRRKRCGWETANPLMTRYHDEEWGVPLHDDRRHFEFLVLDAFQAGLSWATILNKRENFRRAFAGFDPVRVARLNRRSVDRLMRDAGIVRNRAKIESAITNARAFLEVQEAFGSFDRYIWRFVNGAPKQSRWKAMNQVPATSRESDRMSADLKARGFRFVGSTICYAYMQAAGLVNDHTVSCFRHGEVAALAAVNCKPPTANAQRSN
jgi:DNA-3-methyladenine glycosylase I